MNVELEIKALKIIIGSLNQRILKLEEKEPQK